MKRFLALAALILGMVSCQTEPEGLDVIVGGAQDVTVTVAIPEAETRADWNFSKEGAFKNVVGSDAYTIRYIFDVYYGEDRAERQVKYSDDQSVAFGVRLVPEREYSFVVWADVVEQTDREENAWSNDDNAYYDTEYLTAVSLKPNAWVAMDETRDAFTGVHTETNYTGSSNITISLTRPFAKLRVVTTDFDELKKFGIEATYAKVVYTTPYVSTFNALEGKAVAAEESGAKKIHEYTIKSYEDEKTGDEHTIFSDYIFTVDPGVVKFNMEVFEDAAMEKRIKANSFNTDIQVRPNYITTLKGDVLTDGGKVTVTVKPGFEDEIVKNYVDTAKDLQDAINAAEDGVETTIRLGGDVVIDDVTTRAEAQYGLVIPATKVIVLDLNGKTISQTKAQSGKYAMIENNGTLTICNSANTVGTLSYGDTATLTADVGYASNTIQNNGVLTINEGVVIENTSGEGVATYGYPHVIDTNGTLTINGGTLTNEANYSTMRIWTSNTDAEKCNVVINGGIFNGCIDFQAHNNNSATIPHYGTLTVNGGTFNKDTFTQSSIRVLRFAVNANDMHAAINGGNFDGKVWVRNIGTFAETPKIINIYGGTFTTEAKDNSVDALADGYSFVEGENGTYTVASLGYYTDASGNYHITGVNGWLWMADQNDTFFRNKTVYLDNDIDFAGVDMRVTRMWTDEYSATFDGQNHTISNVWMASAYNQNNQALFDGLMTVKNLTVENSHVYGMSQVGIIGANIYGTIENCHVKKCRSYGYVHHVGGIVGLHSWGEIKNCSIENTSIECYYYGAVGAIAGAMNEVSRNITGCSVKDCRLIKEGPEGVYPDWDPLFGIAVGYAYAPGTYVFNVEVENNTIKGVASEQMYGEVATGSTITVNGVQL